MKKGLSQQVCLGLLLRQAAALGRRRATQAKGKEVFEQCAVCHNYRQ